MRIKLAVTAARAVVIAAPAAACANRGWLAGDGVHVNATGDQARARSIAKQVERC